jgi:hypothetical protein
MTANHISAVRTPPFLLFFFQEQSDALFLYAFEVLYHAHVVFVPVSFIEGLQSFAGKLLTFKTEPDQAFFQQIATAFHIGTVLASWDTANTIFPMATLFVQIVFHRQIADADSAVHPTGSNEFFFHGQNSFVNILA